MNREYWHINENPMSGEVSQFNMMLECLQDMSNKTYYDEYEREQNKNKQLQADNEQLRAVIKKAVAVNKELVNNLNMIKNTIIYRALKRVKVLFSYRIKLIKVK